jgi:hypothetical protein
MEVVTRKGATVSSLFGRCCELKVLFRVRSNQHSWTLESTFMEGLEALYAGFYHPVLSRPNLGCKTSILYYMPHTLLYTTYCMMLRKCHTQFFALSSYSHSRLPQIEHVRVSLRRQIGPNPCVPRDAINLSRYSLEEHAYARSLVIPACFLPSAKLNDY